MCLKLGQKSELERWPLTESSIEMTVRSLAQAPPSEKLGFLTHRCLVDGLKTKGHGASSLFSVKVPARLRSGFLVITQRSCLVISGTESIILHNPLAWGLKGDVTLMHSLELYYFLVKENVQGSSPPFYR